MAEPDPLLEHQLAALLAAHDDRLAAGSVPSYVSPSELLAAHDDRLAAGEAACVSSGQVPPELEQRWREDAELLRLLDRLRPRDWEQPPPDDPIETEGDGEGRYELARLHAAGGIGRVWMARDVELGRDVALKELRPERAADPAMIARFLHEARITGRLQHPGIVPVYEMAAGRDGEPPFYTMRLVRGQTLTEAARAHHRACGEGRDGRLGLIRLLNAFISICNTVAYAHTRGVVHRDLKGQNVVLGDFGEVIVLDWGFAKILNAPAGGERLPEPGAETVLDADAPPDHTRAGQMLGTPAYMAPEQAEGRLDLIGPRTDVFGLGAILYEILTGQPPFAGETTAEVLRKARAGEPPKPRTIAPTAPAALAAVCMRAMARQPADRYASAADLAREVQHWLADEPIETYREPLTDRLLRWMRHHRPAVAVLLTALFTGFLISIAGVAIIGEARSRAAHVQMEAEAERAQARAEADAQVQRQLEEQLYFQRVALAERELAVNNLNRAETLLNSCPQRLRSWEWFYLKRCCHEEPRPLTGHRGAVSAVAFHPDGRRLASAGRDRTIKLWDADSGREYFTLSGHDDVVYDVAFSPDGRRLASASWDGTVKLWDLEDRRPVHSFTGHGSIAHRLAFRPDGRHLAILGEADMVTIRDLEKGTIVARFQIGPGQCLYRLVYCPDGSQLVLTASDGIYFLEAATGRLIRQLPVPGLYVKCLAFRPDGRLFATGEGDLAYGHPGRVRLWDTESGHILFTFDGHTEPIFGLAFTRDGSRLFSASQDKTVKVWDMLHRQEALTLRGHTDTVNSLALRGDDRQLATAGADGVVRLWDAAPSESMRSPDELLRLEGHGEAVFAAAFMPDGGRVISLSHQGTIKIWDAANGRPLATHAQPQQSQLLRYFSLALSPDGARIAVTATDGQVRLEETETGRLLAFFTGHQAGPLKSVAFSADGRRLASAGWGDRTVRIWPVDGGEPLVLTGHREPVLGVAFHPDGHLLASASYDKTVRLWDATTGQLLHTLTGHASRVHGVAFSHSGHLLASAGNDDVIHLWRPDDGRLIATLHGHTAGVSAADFSPDDRFLASAGHDRTVKIWDVAAARELLTLRGHDERVYSVAFRRDGRRLCSASHDQTVRIWSFQPPQ